MIQPEHVAEDEWVDWYRLTPLQRWLESERLWQTSDHILASGTAHACAARGNRREAHAPVSAADPDKTAPGGRSGTPG